MQIQGKVTSVSVKGYGPNSAQLLFSVQADGPAGRKESFVALYEPTHAAQAFTGIAGFVTAAYFAKARIAVDYKVAHPTNHVVEVYSPPPRLAKSKSRKG